MKYLQYIGAALIALLGLVTFFKRRSIDKTLENQHKVKEEVANLEGQITVNKQQLSEEEEKQKALKEQLEKDKNDPFNQNDALDQLNRRDH